MSESGGGVFKYWANPVGVEEAHGQLVSTPFCSSKVFHELDACRGFGCDVENVVFHCECWVEVDTEQFDGFRLIGGEGGICGSECGGSEWVGVDVFGEWRKHHELELIWVKLQPPGAGPLEDRVDGILECVDGLGAFGARGTWYGNEDVGVVSKKSGLDRLGDSVG